ncbi:hypothetical protein EI94DRAFT_1790253 [Lactarius quietus]|nr:hypothetical protein EI94DRAFT_1790253 [Lactarius quietus]
MGSNTKQTFVWIECSAAWQSGGRSYIQVISSFRKEDGGAPFQHPLNEKSVLGRNGPFASTIERVACGEPEGSEGAPALPRVRPLQQPSFLVRVVVMVKDTDNFMVKAHQIFLNEWGDFYYTSDTRIQRLNNGTKTPGLITALNSGCLRSFQQDTISCHVEQCRILLYDQYSGQSATGCGGCLESQAESLRGNTRFMKRKLTAVECLTEITGFKIQELVPPETLWFSRSEAGGKV